MQNKSGKAVVSAVLSLLILASCWFTPSLYAEEVVSTKSAESGYALKGKGNLDSPYLISTAEELAYVIKNGGQSGGYYKLTNDIYLNDVTKIDWETGTAESGYTPNQWFTEDNSSAFSGHINGDGYMVFGLYITEVADSKCAGLIPRLASGADVTVENLGIDYAWMCSDNSAKMAIFTGHANDASSATYNMCFTGENTHVTAGSAGVFSAYNGATVCNITNCYSNTTLSGTNHAGLIANIWSFKASTLKNIYSTGGIRLCAKHDSGLAEAYLPYKDTLYFGGFTPDDEGYVSGGIYWQSKHFASLNNMRGFDVLKNSDKMPNLGDAFVAANTYPVLKVFANREDMIKRMVWDGDLDGNLLGDGTEESPYLVSSPEELAYVIKNGGKISKSKEWYKLTGDIYLNDITKIDWSTGKADEGYTPNQWFTSATVLANFIGNIDGDGHKILGLYSTGFGDGSNASYGGLIPYVNYENVSSSGTVSIKNLGMDYLFVSSDKSKSYGSAFIGYTQNAPSTISFENCFAGDNAYIKTDMPAVFFAHGAPSTIIKNCFSRANIEDVSGAVTGGGFIGHTWSSGSATATVSSVYSTVSIYGYANYPDPWNSLTDAEVGSFYYHRASKQWYIPKASYINSLSKMQGTDVFTSSSKMPRLDQEAFYATEGYPELKVFADTVNITFDANGGSFEGGVTTLSASQMLNKAFTVSAPVSADGNLEFAGWSFYPTGSTVAEKVSSHMEGATLYAVYKKAITLTFDANGGSFKDGALKTVKQYVGLSLTTEEPANPAGVFLGWSYDQGGNSMVTGDVTADMEGKTLYAVWKIGPHDGEYKTFSRTVDYSDYTVDAYNTYSENFRKISDDSADGGAYLKLKVDSSAGSWQPNYNLVVTESGDITDELCLPASTNYKITLKIRTHELSGGAMTLYSIYGYDRGDQWSMTTANNNANSAYSQYNEIMKGISQKADWTEVVAYFTTPDTYLKDSSGNLYNQCYIGLTVGGGKDFEYDVDSINIEKVSAVNLYIDDGGKKKLFDTYYGAPGAALTLPETVSKEIYLADGTATVATTDFSSWYTDTYEGEIIYKFGNSAVDFYCDAVSTSVTDTENQKAYCGFDEYAVHSVGTSFDPDLAEITNEQAYTGTHAMKLGGSTAFEIRNNTAVKLLAGVTYKVSVSYRADSDATVFVGLSRANEVPESFEALAEKKVSETDTFKTVSFLITPDKGTFEGFALALSAEISDTLYLDNIVVSALTESVGVGTDGDNLRFMFTYNGIHKAVLEGKEYGVSERGILVKGAESNAELVIENKNSKGVFGVAAADLSNCWSINSVTKATVYSVNMKNLASDDDYEISARGYLKLANGEIYYTDIFTAARRDIPEASELIPEGTDLADYYLYLPEGTKLTDTASDNIDCYDAFFNKTAANLSENVLQSGCYVMFKTKIDAEEITVPAELMYTVHSGTKAELYYGLDAKLISDNLAKTDQKTVNYIFITDIHYDASTSAAQKTALLSQLSLIRDMANDSSNNIDFIAVGGDTTTGLYSTKQAQIDALGEILAPLKDATVPVFVLMGNHDDNSYHAELASYNKSYVTDIILSDKDWTDKVLPVNEYAAEFVHDTVRPYSKYYYCDIADKKTRVICLDASDYNAPFDENGNITALPVMDENATSDQSKYATANSFKGYSDEQLSWLKNEALTAGEGWSYVFLSHMGIDSETNSYAPVNSDRFRDIITEHQNTSDEKIVVFQFGHTHLELSLYGEDINIWQICSASANVSQSTMVDEESFLKNNSIGNKSLPWNFYPRAIGTKGEAAFDVMSVNENSVHKQAVGNGATARYIYPAK